MSAAQLQPLAMVAALTPSRVIGAKGGIPWHVPEDMKHFREVTRGHAVIMGRATYESIGKPLAKRRNIVISRNPALRYEGCEVVPNLAQALSLAREHDAEPRIIGGAQIYVDALPLATRLLLTHLEQDHAGDTYFPEIDPAQWRQDERREGPGVVWVTWVRR